VEAALAVGREMLTGPESQAIVAAYDIATVGAATAATPAEAAAAAARIGAPVALKILSRDISHKSDVGGVALDLGGAAAVEAAARAMLERVRERRPEACVDGFTVEPMIRRPGAHELIAGMVEDEQFGPVILFGQGGVAVEVVEDRALALPPLNMNLARELMGRTRVHRLLQGYRDRPAAALDAIALTLIKLSQLVTDVAEIAELDINPLLADPAGVIALDVRIRLRRPARAGPARLAIRPYPRELEEGVEVEGRRLLLRPVRPEDEPAFRRAFAKLSPQAVRMRFFAPLSELSHALGARLTQLDYDREMALVLADPGPAGPAEIYGVVRIGADPDNERAEFAVIVRDDMTGKGIGRLLMRRIIDYAAGRGIGEIFGDVLAENAPMLDMCRRLGFVIEDGFGEAGVVRVHLRLAQASPR
ncbi:MAG TPA: GNAT family N-acetyltransferase, partial [Dongiaceae bacterium]|nr:GNAT family N-acetyltransferase [Dongiaceae bacterium]